MSTHDNAPPPADWVVEPRCCPFPACSVCQLELADDEHIIRAEN